MKTWFLVICLGVGNFAMAQDTIAALPVQFASDALFLYNSESLPYLPDSVVGYAKTFLGTAYKAAGKTPAGFDCSGLVGFVFGHFGITLASSSRDIAFQGKEINKIEAQRGDLIFFKGHDQNGPIGHVGIVVSDSGKAIKWIHSSSSHGVRIDGFENQYFKERFVIIKRIVAN